MIHNLHIQLVRNLKLLALSTLAGCALLGEEDGVDVGEDSALGDGDSSQKLVQLLVITDGKLKVSMC